MPNYRLCVVQGCFNTSKNKEISFFSTSDEKLRLKWKNANAPYGWKNLKSFFVCSEHFAPDEISVVNNVRRLSCPSKTIPSIFSR
jgi:hypothetical protein